MSSFPGIPFVRPPRLPAPHAPLTLEGWYVLHQVFRLSLPRLRALSPDARRTAFSELAGRFERWADGSEGEGDIDDGSDRGWSGAYRLFGGGADLMALHFRPSLEEIGGAERIVPASASGDLLVLRSDYVSVVELGLYSSTVELLDRLERDGIPPGSEEGRDAIRELTAAEREKSYVRDRLHPRQPAEMPYLSFYPMDKRRDPGQNWYALPLEERAELMAAHGRVGRRYADRISQVISGSMGFDDWEWAVTLFGKDPLDFKELVAEMRYDEVSARYAEFGPFRVGKRMARAGWEELAELS